MVENYCQIVNKMSDQVFLLEIFFNISDDHILTEKVLMKSRVEAVTGEPAVRQGVSNFQDLRAWNLEVVKSMCASGIEQES